MLSPFPSRAHVVVCLNFGGAVTVRHDADLGFAFNMDFFASDMDFDIDFDFTFDMEFDIDSFANTSCGFDDSVGRLFLRARLWK